MKIALLEPFFTGSHRRWAEELRERSRHAVTLFTLPGRHWKWRMHGAAITLAEQFLGCEEDFDLILATDMLDLAAFLGHARAKCATTPVALYFHENQLSYPWSPEDPDPGKKRDLHYAFINYSSALAADAVYFNSRYHKESFLGALPRFLKIYPDCQNLGTLAAIEKKSQVLPLGMDLQWCEARKGPRSEIPLLIWNHRWEYDKNPEAFCETLCRLHDCGVAFEVALLGESFRKEPPYFCEMKTRLGDKIVHYGRAASVDAYRSWLRRGDILPVTSQQDFFGGSVVEAIAAGCHPLLPLRLAYPEHVAPEKYPDYYYSEDEAFFEKLKAMIESRCWREESPVSEDQLRYDWRNAIDSYDDVLAGVCSDYFSSTT